jgi:hypothetical protein
MGRIYLDADTTVTVAQDGSGQFCAIQDAVNYCRDNIDACGHKLVIQVAPGTYTDPVELFDVPGVRPGAYNTRHLAIRGDVLNPGNVQIACNSGGGAFNSINCKCGWVVEGFTISNPSGGAIDSHAGSHVYAGTNRYGACGTFHLIAGYKSFLEVVGPYEIVGGAQYHWAATQQSQIVGTGHPVTLTGNPYFSAFFAYATQHSLLVPNGIVWSGPARGIRFQVDCGAGIAAGIALPGGYNYFPGNVAGTIVPNGPPPGWYY